MKYTPHVRGECEAFRLLRLLLDGNATERFRAAVESRRLMASFKETHFLRQTGRKISAVTPDQLREIARLDALDEFTQYQIAKRVGVRRGNVAHHLKPSKAMLAAVTEEAA